MQENSKEIMSILEESMTLEINIGRLYMCFADKVPIDYNFWNQLAEEEITHSSLVNVGIDFLKIGDFPNNWPIGDLDDLVKTNRDILSLITNYQRNIPSRKEALEIALRLEQSAAEKHYQTLMNIPPEHDYSGVFKIFQELNGADKNHAERIERYIAHNRIV